MGQDCAGCCTTAEEGKQEINDDNDIKIAPGYQSLGIGQGNNAAQRGSNTNSRDVRTIKVMS